MAKYIITERQEKLLKEIRVVPGELIITPLYNVFKYLIIPKLKTNSKFVIQSTRMFFRDEMGKNLKKYNDGDLENYLIDLSDTVSNRYSKSLRKPATIASLAYYLVKKMYKFQEFQGLEYIKKINSPFYRYLFFDPEIQEFIGFMEVRKSLSLPGNSMKVTLSSVEREYIGRGYGSRMYMCVINQVDYLESDDNLYPDSLNMWVNYLPNKVNVWAEVYDEDSMKNKYVLLSSENFISPEDIESLIASNKKTKPPRI